MQDRIVRTLLIAATLGSIGEGMLGPMLSIFTQKIGGSPLDIAASWSVYLIVTGLFMVVVGYYTDRIEAPEWLLVLGYLLNALCTFGYIWVESPAHLLLVQAGLGIANALATPTWDVLFSRNTPNEQSGALWGAANGQEHIITGIAIMIGSSLVYYTSFHVLFVIMGLLQLAATLVQSRLLHKPAQAGEKPVRLLVNLNIAGNL